jgi:hypothetical protein
MLRSAFVLAGLVLIVAGCGAPQPPEKVNAFLPKNMPPVAAGSQIGDKADALVLARCTKSHEYATTVDGDWVNSWCLTTWGVLRVERGKWPPEMLSFVFCDRWRVPKTGMTWRKPPIPYYVGAVRAFFIDTAGGKPTIVADEARSRILPYGTVTRPSYSGREPEAGEFFNRIVDMARAFVMQERGVHGMASVTEQNGRWYVVEIETGNESIAVVVDAESWIVKWADPADEPK